MADVIGVSLAIPGLVILAAQAYMSIKEFIEAYQNLDRDMDKILLSITQAENMFMLHIRTLLQQVLEPEDVASLLQRSRENSHENEDAMLKRIHDQIQQTLDPSFVSVLQGQIQNVSAILNTIQCMLSDTLAQRKPGDIRGSPVHTSNRISPFILFFESTMRSLRVKKHKTKQTINRSNSKVHEQLKTLYEEIARLSTCHHIIKFKENTGSRLTLTAYKSRMGTISGNVMDSRYPRTLEEYRTAGEISNSLYETLSRLPRCSCHMLYLCLEPSKLEFHGDSTAINQTTLDSDYAGRFSVIVASYSACGLWDHMSAPAHNSRHNVFLNFRQSSTSTNNVGNALQIPGLCGKYFLDKNENEYMLESFHVQPIQDRPKSLREEISAAVTLRDLLQKDDSPMQAQAEKLLLAAKLGFAAFLLHSSPWFKLWTTQKIAFLAEYESSPNPGDWSPHLMALLPSSNTERPNCEDLYRLGLILLEIGGISSETLTHREGLQNSTPTHETLDKMEFLVKLESDKLIRIVGGHYKRAVQQCFKIYFDQARISYGSPIPEDSMVDLFNTFKSVEKVAQDMLEDF
ncbi:hypothetical protein BZA77DRAFT_302889 [Pyronema omphalodes]|nr:hypothetical protein BZA77DRAFT_302889 [Pyronema omphalodes]